MVVFETTEDAVIQTVDGITIYEKRWSAANPKGVVLITHGIAEHSGRYEHVAKSLVDSGFSVYSYDLRGHGQSSGKRCYVHSFQDYLNDLGMVLGNVRAAYPDSPVFLLGHSLGGAIVSLFVIERRPEVAGVILSAPAVVISDDISPMLQKLSGILSKLTPNLPVVKLESAHISRDPEVVLAYDSDPLNYRGGILARTGAEMLHATKSIQSQFHNFHCPLLLLHGTGDKLTDPSGSQAMYAGVSSTDKDLKLYDGLYHEVMNEPEKEQVKEDIVTWLNNHLTTDEA